MEHLGRNSLGQERAVLKQGEKKAYPERSVLG